MKTSLISKTRTKVILSIAVLLMIAVLVIFYTYGRALWVPAVQKVVGKRTVDDIVQMHEASVDRTLKPLFEKAGAQYPPQKITLLAIKNTKHVELWSNDGIEPTFIRRYPVKAASGLLGPKLIEGDRQVPEGVYQLEYLNPNSAYHLSMKLNYPNAFDRKYAQLEGRDQPGTNIFIHGKSVSIGCLAMGDRAIEELFVLTAKIGRSNVTVAIAPSDPRLKSLENTTSKPWVDDLYQSLFTFFQPYKLEG